MRAYTAAFGPASSRLAIDSILEYNNYETQIQHVMMSVCVPPRPYVGYRGKYCKERPKNVEIKIQENKKNLTKKIKFPPDRAPLLRDEVVRNETREMHTKHARANPKFHGAKKNLSDFFQNKMFSHGIIHSITLNLNSCVRGSQSKTVFT